MLKPKHYAIIIATILMGGGLVHVFENDRPPYAPKYPNDSSKRVPQIVELKRGTPEFKAYESAVHIKCNSGDSWYSKESDKECKKRHGL